MRMLGGADWADELRCSYPLDSGCVIFESHARAPMAVANGLGILGAARALRSAIRES